MRSIGMPRSLMMVAVAQAVALSAAAWPSPAAPRNGVAVVSPGSPAATNPELVALGARWWTESPDPQNPVACATCHHDPEATRGWAASFPKVKPLPPPHTRVMTLFQANAAAVARHYRLRDPRPAAAAITAYLTAQAGDAPISPGISTGQPVFGERIRQLAVSAKRGEGVFARRCAACHEAVAVAPLVLRFPRVRDRGLEAIEIYLESHRPVEPPSASGPVSGLAWNGQAMADLIAFLMARLAGQPVSQPRLPADIVRHPQTHRETSVNKERP